MLVAFASAGCSSSCGGGTPSAPESPVVETPEPTPEPPSMRPTISREPLPEGATYRLFRFPIPLSEVELDVVDLGFERTVGDALWEQDALLVVNGGYWDTELHPEGLVVVGGEVRYPFDPELGGGVLVVDGGRARLLDAEADGFTPPDDVDLALQCRPRILVDGEVNIASDDGRYADRTALCIRDEGRTLEVAIARTDDEEGHGGPTLFAFGEQLRAHGCRDALNLDGGGSTGAAWVQDGRRELLPTRANIRLVLVVRDNLRSR